MLTENQILSNLDNFKSGDYYRFIDLGNEYSYLIDSRLNIFRGEADDWAITAERLGYNPRAGSIELEIFYFGNCLINLDVYNDQPVNYYTVWPIENDSYQESIDGEIVSPDATIWNLRGEEIKLSHRKKDFQDAGIDLKEYEPGEISIEEMGRWLILEHQELFRATDEELYRSIPRRLKKILVIDEWYHRDFNTIDQPVIDNDHLRSVYDFNKNLSGDAFPYSYEQFAEMMSKHEKDHATYNENQWLDNRPGSYETWQLIARVIALGDPGLYTPGLAPNSHWENWPDSGSL